MFITPTLTEVVPPDDELSVSLYNNVILDTLPTAPAAQAPEQTSNAPTKDPEATDEPTPRWKLMRVTANAHDGWVRTLCVDPFNQFVALGGADNTIKVWDITGARVKAAIAGHVLPVRALATSAKYPYLFSGSEDRMVKCWDLERSHTPHSLVRDYYGHVGGVYALALHPELDVLFSGGSDRVVRGWDIRSRQQVVLLTGHREEILVIASQAGDPQVITALLDRTVCLWDLRNQSQALQITQHGHSIRAMAMHPLELTFTSADLRGNFKQWLLPRGQLLNQFETTGDDRIVNVAAINPVTNELLAGYDNGKLEWWDYAAGSVNHTAQTTAVNTTEPTLVYSAAFDILGTRLFTGEGDKTIKIWGLEDSL